MKRLLISTLILTAIATSALAGTFKLPKEDPIASMTFPKSWKVDLNDETLDASSNDNEIYINVETTDSGSIEGAMEESFGYLKKNKVKVDKDSLKKTETKINGMDVLDLSYDGTDADGVCKISLTIVSVTKEKGLLVLYWASPEGEKKHQKELDSIITSIKSLL